MGSAEVRFSTGPHSHTPHGRNRSFTQPTPGCPWTTAHGEHCTSPSPAGGGRWVRAPRGVRSHPRCQWHRDLCWTCPLWQLVPMFCGLSQRWEDVEQPGCEQDQPPSRVLCSFGVGCTPLAAELQQRIGAGGSRGGSRRRRCVFLAECNALSKWFWYFAVAPVLTHRCSSVTPAPSPVFAKKRRIPSRPGLLGEGPCREQSAPSPTPRGASSRAVSRGQAPGHAAGRSLVLLTRGLLFSCLQLSQKFGSRARNSG